jgi:predicted alpha/beta hydrolase family esterase
MAGLTGAVRTAASYKNFIAVLFLAGACSTTPAPTSELAAARSAVAQAQSAAALDASGVLASAQDKLVRAEQAMQRGEHLHARLFAEQAEADARLALASAENARARR